MLNKIKQLASLIGQQTEGLALGYLQGQGLTLVSRNFRCKGGEIDLIMRDHNHLVFVEVRFRASASFGSAVESIERRKQLKLTRAAQAYLQQQQLVDTQACRFDTLCIQGDQHSPEFYWVRNAF